MGWEQTKEHIDHDGSVNAVAWAPDAMGCAVLACASADGDISILTLTKGIIGYNRWLQYQVLIPVLTLKYFERPIFVSVSFVGSTTRTHVCKLC